MYTQLYRTMSVPILTIIFLVLPFASLFASDQGEEFKIVHLRKPDICSVFAKVGDLLTVHYNGSFIDRPDEIFDSSQKQGHPLKFKLGRGEVIPGWDRGLLGCCMGELRKLIVPPALAYGSKGSSPLVPADATLVFHVEVIDIKDDTKPVNVFREVDIDANKKLTKDEVAAYFKKEASRLNVNVTEWDISDMVWEVFEIDDKNKDGLISRREFSGPVQTEL